MLCEGIFTWHVVSLPGGCSFFLGFKGGLGVRETSDVNPSVVIEGWGGNARKRNGTLKQHFLS